MWQNIHSFGASIAIVCDNSFTQKKKKKKNSKMKILYKQVTRLVKIHISTCTPNSFFVRILSASTIFSLEFLLSENPNHKKHRGREGERERASHDVGRAQKSRCTHTTGYRVADTTARRRRIRRSVRPGSAKTGPKLAG